MIQEFWISIAKDLEQQEGTHPSTWKKNYIETHFLPNLEKKVTQLCQEDNEKRNLCCSIGKHIVTTSYNTFWKFLQNTPPAQGNAKTRHIYAIYLGYQSCEDYCQQKGIPPIEEKTINEKKGERLSGNKQSKDTSQINIFSGFNKSIAKNIKGKLRQWNFFGFGNSQEVIDDE